MIRQGDSAILSKEIQFITHDNEMIKFSNRIDLIGINTVGANRFMCMNTLLLPGVNIYKNCIVGARCIVIKSFTEERIIVASSPDKLGFVNDYVTKYEESVFNFKNNKKKKNLILINENNLLIKNVN